MAKRTVTREVDCCDQCGKELDYEPPCMRCGKVYCYDCRKTELVEYQGAVWGGGWRDGRYCNACDQEMQRTGGDALYRAYKEITKLRHEHDGFVADFEPRRKRVEGEIKRLIEEREAQRKEA